MKKLHYVGRNDLRANSNGWAVIDVCPICNKPLKDWIVLGGGIKTSCSDITCKYEGVDK